ncbi:organic cation transporter-like protein, partial [Plakobranchus ocellatus]
MKTTVNLELLPQEYRSYETWLGGSVWGLGMVLFAIIASFFKRHLYQTSAILMLSENKRQCCTLKSHLHTSLNLDFMDESLRWLIVNGKAQQAEKVIRRIAKMNKRNEVPILEQFHEKLALRKKNGGEKLERPKQKDSQQLSVLYIFKVKRLFFNSVCLWFC